MVIRKPVKRARTLFSDVVKGMTLNTAQMRLNHGPRSQLNNKKIQKSSAKKTLAGKKVNLTDMSMYKEVSIKHMLCGDEMTCLKKFCTGGSDMKVGCSWAQFKGNHIDAIEVVFIALKDLSYIREDDHRSGTTYMIFNSIKDLNNLMSTKLVYNDKPIDLYQTVKIEEDITVVNIPNFRDVGIEPMAKLILKELGPCSNAEAPPVSAAPQTDDSNSVIAEAQPSTKPVEKSKIINDTEVSTNDEAATAKPGTINRLRGTVGLKKPLFSSLNAAVMPPSSNEKLSSDDDTKSDGSDDGNHQPIIKRTAKSTINRVDFSDISVDSDMSSPMEIKKEFISPNLSPKSDSDGYSPASEHALMAAKARMGQISHQTFNQFVTNVDKAPPESNKAAIEPESDANQ
ncbi:hypothetical protein AYI70_g5417 [Smittium culicis]|uniref:Uncharacterized protein n=1 Tax=Smittium culicis TaxID=133412 RepID=A0A1R1XUJ2_9FUNG|nr:hypothetical protein AYI70_g5417 [Smittium culicis]